MEDQGFPANSARMRHWLLRAAPLLAALLGIWAPLSFATPRLRSSIDPAIPIVSQQQQQQQQSGPQALSLSPAYRRSSPSVTPTAIGKRDGIHIQELSSSFLLHYHVFTVSILYRSPRHKTSLQETSEATCSFVFPYIQRMLNTDTNSSRHLPLPGPPHPGSQTSGSNSESSSSRSRTTISSQRLYNSARDR